MASCLPIRQEHFGNASTHPRDIVSAAHHVCITLLVPYSPYNYIHPNTVVSRVDLLRSQVQISKIVRVRRVLVMMYLTVFSSLLSALVLAAALPVRSDKEHA